MKILITDKRKHRRNISDLWFSKDFLHITKCTSYRRKKINWTLLKLNILKAFNTP